MEQEIDTEKPPVNMSGILPTGGHILVLPKVVEETTAGGIIIPRDIREKDQQAATEGMLIAVGSSAWADLDDGKAWAKVGDKISYSRYAGVSMEGQDGEQYVLINDNDVLARLLF
ncbi:MAG: co-chaperone GroES [Thiomicrorhabdus sp.]|jgi:chaperonin GroES|nr:co-chaperone GroES [Thiomicrorhabdus sp.]